LAPDAAPPALHTPPLHDALPIFEIKKNGAAANGINAGESLTLSFTHDGSFDLGALVAAINANEIRFAIHYQAWTGGQSEKLLNTDRKSTRLNSSHVKSSYAVFCF